jgi:hypothetical protein
MRDLHERIKDQLARNHTRTLRGPHFTALVEYWLTGRSPVAPAAPAPSDERRAAA